MSNKELKLTLLLSGECLFFFNFVKSETDMSFDELFLKMIELYKLVYLSKYELALVEGDIIVQKFNTEDLKQKTTNL